MTVSPQRVKRALQGADHPLGLQELLREAGLKPGEQTELKRALRELVRSGEVEKTGKRFQLPGLELPKATPRRGAAPLKGSRSARRVEGVLHLHRDGFGFVHPVSGEGENIFVPVEQARRAFDNDRVIVELVPGQGGRSAGRLLKVVDRLRTQVVGTYVDRPKGAWVEPHDKTLKGPIRVPRTQMARDGDVVKVRLDVGAELLAPGDGLFGEVSGSLGKPGDSSVEVLSIAFSQGFSDEFPSEVMDEADAISLGVTDAEARGESRRDLRPLPLVTIDGEDARDFDDAIYVETRGGDYRLVVAIADVSHYVREGTALDAEAVRRATSVYLPDRVLPMLPERLSNGICSLKPDEDRLCMVADLVLDRHGQQKSAQIYPGVMRSVARCTYNEVHKVLAGEDVPRRTELRPHFERMQALASTLTAMRASRGAIDFDLPEAKIELDDAGKPTRMVRRDRLESHRLVEECMLAANEAVARYCQEQQLPSVYRFHGEPDAEKLAAFAALAKIYGFHLVTTAEGVSSKDLNALLQKLEGHPEQKALNQLLLRSMMQAVYSAEQVGHYGLAAENYLHFTSPIRRYPDLLVHRVLKAHWTQGRRKSASDKDAETEKLAALALQSSERERAAMQVEREVVSFYSTLLMKDRVGEAFEATVSSLTDFGFFVELEGLFIEGLVKGESVEPTFELDKQIYAVVFGSGRKVRVGQKLEVRLVSVNTQRRQLDFEVVAFAGEDPLPASDGTSRRDSGRPTKRPGVQRRGAAAPKHHGASRLTAPPQRVAAQEPELPSRLESKRAEEPAAPVKDWRERLRGRAALGGDQGDRPRRREAPPGPSESAPEATGSPHPGFDRLRALAARGGQPEGPAPRSRGAPGRGGSKKAGGREGRPAQRPGKKGRGKPGRR